jgi:hypothetical protein
MRLDISSRLGEEKLQSGLYRHSPEQCRPPVPPCAIPLFSRGKIHQQA